MLIVKALEDIQSQGVMKGDEFRLYIFDVHHHMGKEKSHRNTPPGAYEFYALLWFELQKIAESMRDRDELLFEPIKVVAPPMTSAVFRGRKNWSRMDHGWLVDRTSAFPYTDDYSKSTKKGVPSFKVSNDKIFGWTTRAPHSTRLIGFARVDPNDATEDEPDIAVNEVNRSVQQLGLRGLKLHPLAQLFVEDIQSNKVARVVGRAGDLGIPVLFDTRNIRTVLRIKELVDSMRNDAKLSKSLDGLKIILAHSGMSPGKTKLYETLKDPIFYADTSSLHGKDIPVLFEMAEERLSQVYGGWSTKFMFGTDYSFLSVQAVDVILHVLSRDFKGTLLDAQRVLAGNALSAIQRPYKTTMKTLEKPEQFTFEKPHAVAEETFSDLVVDMLQSGVFELKSLDYMLPPGHSWPDIEPLSSGGFNGVNLDSSIATFSKKDCDYEIHLWLRQSSIRPSCVVIGTHGEYALESSELYFQKIGKHIIKYLETHSTKVSSKDELKERIQSFW